MGNEEDEDEKGSMQLEVIPPSALESITRGEIDTQIATAHKYPRSMTAFKTRAISMATIDQQTAESCIYCRPVGKKDGKMQYAEGLSVRMAEIVGASYGNLRVGSTLIEQTDRYVIARGFAHDLETNFASSSEVKEATVTKDGRPFSEGMRAVIAKAALSKARRDATFQVVPKALCRPIEAKARALITGDAKSLSEKRNNWVGFLQRYNIDLTRVWSALGVTGPDDLTTEHLMTLVGVTNAIKEGSVEIDDAFPPLVTTGKIGAAGMMAAAKGASTAAPTTTTPAGSGSAGAPAGDAPGDAPAGAVATGQPAGDINTPTTPAPKTPKPKPQPKGPPTANDLREDLVNLAKKSSIGRSVLIEHLHETGKVPENTLADFEALEAQELADIIADFDAIKAAILAPPQ